MFKRHKIKLIVFSGMVVAIALGAAVLDGLRHSADLKASELLANAKTVQDFQAILAQAPRSYLAFDALMNLGMLLHTQGKIQDAKKYYEQALELYPKGFQAAASLQALGMLSAEQKDLARASQFFERAIAVDPRGVKAPESWFQWGRVLQAAGDAKAAKEKYEKVLAEFPESPWAEEARSKKP